MASLMLVLTLDSPDSFIIPKLDFPERQSSALVVPVV